MLTLAFDTSSSKGGVAVLDDRKIVSEISWDREVSHGELLTPAIEKALEEAQLSIQAIDLIAIGNGPGSFTGVRVAVNTARALSYASAATDERRTPVMVFDSTEILAAGVERRDLPVLTLINAHKNLVFTSSFSWTGSGWVRRLPLEAVDAESAVKLISETHLCVGDGYFEIENSIPKEVAARFRREGEVPDAPLARVVGLLAAECHGRRPTFIWNQVQPLYIRASGAEEKLEEIRRTPVRK